MLNNVNLMGRLTADPVVRYTHTNNVPVANFSLAVDRRLIKGREKEVDFINIVAWQGTADFVAKYFTKGQPICVEGRLQQRTWLDEVTKTNRSVIEVIAENVHFAGFKRDDAQNNNAEYDPTFDPYAAQAA
ncbi:MAG: single-stranded DNA-binding protein [Defluviitaleaceae bacterium]|nr:single-stranded DNA-binding protein [Defluviitaleaceae bacterium]